MAGRRPPMRRKNQSSFWKRGTLTVEASVIVPMVFVMTAALIILLYFEHNRVWYLSASVEMAVCANGYQAEGAESPESAANVLAQTRVREQVFPGTSPNVNIKRGSQSTSVSISGQRFAAFRDQMIWTVQTDVKKVDPVSALRKVRAVKSFTKGD